MDILAFYRRSLRIAVYWTLFLSAVLSLILFWRRTADGFMPMSWHLPLMLVVFGVICALLRVTSLLVFCDEIKARQQIGLFLIPVGLLFLGSVFRLDAIPEFLLGLMVASIFHYVLWFWGMESNSKTNSLSVVTSVQKKSVVLDNSSKVESTESEDFFDEESEEDEENFDAMYPPDVCQSWTRKVDEFGCDIQTGWFRVAFETGQHHASVNIAFCPPFSVTPKTECYIIDAPEIMVCVGACYPHGARIDLKLPLPSSMNQSALIGFKASQNADQ